MRLAVAAASIACSNCGSRSFDVERCQWCCKPFKGHEPRAATTQEQSRRCGANGKTNEQTYRKTLSRHDYNHGNDALVTEMEQFVTRYNMTAGRFSRLCTTGKDPYLFERVTQGGNPRLETKDKIRAFMDTYKTADIFD